MAKPKQEAEKQAPRNGARDSDAGFVSEGGDVSAPFWAVEQGARIKGKLLGAYDMPDQFNRGKRRDIVQVLTTEPTLVSVKGEEEAVEVEAGSIVSIDVKARLRSLVTKHAAMVDAGAEVHILLTVPKARQKTSSGNMVWPIEVKTRLVRPPTRPVIPRTLASEQAAVPMANRSPDAAGDDVPY